MTRVFSLAGLAVMMAASAFPADFLPLRPGNTWTYREAATGRTFTVRVGTPLILDSRVYYSLAGYVDSAASRATVAARVDERGNLVYFDEERYAEALLTSFEPVDGRWWDAPVRPCSHQGQSLEKPAPYDGPAGPFAAAFQVQYRTLSCADTGLASEAYVDNIGMVQRVEQSFAGPVRYDLVYAKVGGLLIDATRNARFTVSVDEAPASDELTVTLRLEVNPDSPLKLRFNTGQEYDVAIRDEAGRLLWTWSAGKAFTQALHAREVAGVWSATVAAPSSALPKAGSAIVQGWLTASPDAPQFAAAVPIAAAQAEAAPASPTRGHGRLRLF